MSEPRIAHRGPAQLTLEPGTYGGLIREWDGAAMGASRVIRREELRRRVSGNTRKRLDKDGRATGPIPSGGDGGRRLASSGSLDMHPA